LGPHSPLPPMWELCQRQIAPTVPLCPRPRHLSSIVSVLAGGISAAIVLQIARACHNPDGCWQICYQSVTTGHVALLLLQHLTCVLSHCCSRLWENVHILFLEPFYICSVKTINFKGKVARNFLHISVCSFMNMRFRILFQSWEYLKRVLTLSNLIPRTVYPTLMACKSKKCTRG
jgi:hypothetical protein